MKLNMGASLRETGSHPADQAPAGLGAPRFDPARVRGWLVAMTQQGEDRIWRGAEEALRCFDDLEQRANVAAAIDRQTRAAMNAHYDNFFTQGGDSQWR